MIVGHSFGGMIVFSALAQSLIEAASAPVGRLTPGFADLVLLVNPRELLDQAERDLVAAVSERA